MKCNEIEDLQTSAVILAFTPSLGDRQLLLIRYQNQPRAIDTNLIFFLHRTLGFEQLGSQFDLIMKLRNRWNIPGFAGDTGEQVIQPGPVRSGLMNDQLMGLIIADDREILQPNLDRPRFAVKRTLNISLARIQIEMKFGQFGDALENEIGYPSYDDVRR